ncbi:hypothetical protein L6452_42519 [Arctium lappa]|uniref:Uncharacterized protein n=1 Tax=Arctium lappa TaxID=4217 RepID=A0ACB8XJM1_ARCLA|nr:hypothetical protein L6452_42519 [Arctium lappa]
MQKTTTSVPELLSFSALSGGETLDEESKWKQEETQQIGQRCGSGKLLDWDETVVHQGQRYDNEKQLGYRCCARINYKERLRRSRKSSPTMKDVSKPVCNRLLEKSDAV